MEHRHISHRGQQNKAHSKGSGKNRGKVEQGAGRSSSTSAVELGKEQRYNKMVQLRKQKREDLMLKRRGLNFITDQHEQNLDMASIETLEAEVDNVAPKIVAIMPLSEACDTAYLRKQMVDYCVDYMAQSQKPNRKGNEMEEDSPVDREDAFQAYICPNAGSSANMASRKQRLMFMEIDRNDVYSVLDAGKVADVILMVMSAKQTDASQLKIDPDNASGAIDEQGYRALALLRSQGLVSLIGVLQHLEFASSKR